MTIFAAGVGAYVDRQGYVRLTYRLHHAEPHAGTAAARDPGERDRKLDAERT